MQTASEQLANSYGTVCNS